MLQDGADHGLSPRWRRQAEPGIQVERVVQVLWAREVELAITKQTVQVSSEAPQSAKLVDHRRRIGPELGHGDEANELQWIRTRSM